MSDFLKRLCIMVQLLTTTDYSLINTVLYVCAIELVLPFFVTLEEQIDVDIWPTPHLSILYEDKLDNRLQPVICQ